jgi:hypothetical protein
MINAIDSVKNAIVAPSRQIKGKVSLYKGDTNTLSTTYTYSDALQNIEISRMGGDNKFFGFGICQTAKLKLRDKDNQIVINKDDYFIPSFGVLPAGSNVVIWGGNGVFPQFYIENVQKDEVSGTITITAGDRIHTSAQQYRVKDLVIEAPYTIRAFAEACATKLGLTFEEVTPDAMVEFNHEYAEGANFEGTETLREALNAVAEATQTIYYVAGNSLCFKSLWSAATAALTIEKSQYFNLETKPTRYLGAVCSATELGENIIAQGDTSDATQYVRDNPFWDKLEPTILAQRVEAALAKHEQIGYTPFTLSWRGNFLLEIGDMIGFTNKRGEAYTTPFLNDTITYNGGFRQTTTWAYEDNAGETLKNPSTLGETLKQTFATVDKVNKEISLVASESNANRTEIGALKVSTDNITAAVEDMETLLNDTNGNIETLTSRVEAAVTAEDLTVEIQKELANGTNKVTTTTGFTFNEEGLTISKSDNEITTKITEDGMKVESKNSGDMLTANNQGVEAKNLHARTFLIIGNNSRFEDYGNRTGCFWIGG